eukprot:TRINITY_DN19628_c0_g1_i1.p1 TRINITY_DN19628_c0_g1~~TRINITY_DN19628_c0_g1_i1.p1  ORF type:complete len:271 (-),score=47.36 TRINITY_DN19628_c0_g1_i1:128-940(-)
MEIELAIHSLSGETLTTIKAGGTMLGAEILKAIEAQGLVAEGQALQSLLIDGVPFGRNDSLGAVVQDDATKVAAQLVFSQEDESEREARLERETKEMFDAVESGDASAVGALLASADVLERRNSGGQTPLLEAVRFGHHDIVQLLVDSRANMEAQGKCEFGCRPLHLAAELGRTEIAELLMRAGAKKDAKNRQNRNWTPLHYACSRYHVATVKVLLEARVDVNLPDVMNYTPLAWTDVNRFEDTADDKKNKKDILKLLKSAGGNKGIHSG